MRTDTEPFITSCPSEPAFKGSFTAPQSHDRTEVEDCKADNWSAPSFKRYSLQIHLCKFNKMQIISFQATTSLRNQIIRKYVTPTI